MFTYFLKKNFGLRSDTAEPDPVKNKSDLHHFYNYESGLWLLVRVVVVYHVTIVAMVTWVVEEILAFWY